jgi:hypothetical protein
VSRTPPERRDWLDYHDPTAGLGGAPPARSALRLRLALAGFGIVVCAGGVAASLALDRPGVAVVLAVVGLVAIVDAVVVVARIRRER